MHFCIFEVFDKFGNENYPISVKKKSQIINNTKFVEILLNRQKSGLGICSFAQNRSFKRATVSDSLSMLF